MMRRPDSFGVGLALALVAVFIAIGWGLVALKFLTAWEIAVIAGVGAVLIAAHRPRATQAPFQNTFAHGGARLSSEGETHAASSGGNRAAELHDQTFSD